MPRGAQGFSWLLEVTVSLACLTDVIFSFRTAYESNGSWVTSHDAIARNYMSFWFWIDAPSSVPLELLDLLVDTSHLSIMRLLRLFRLDCGQARLHHIVHRVVYFMHGAITDCASHGA